MSLIVAKFGGTSVASPERIKNVAKRLVRMRQQGVEVVAVVSAMGKTTNRLIALAKEVNLSLWDVQFVKEGADWFLRVFIDKEGGVSIDDCVDMTHALSPVLDKEDPIPQEYMLEVSSPGLERKLTRPEHFAAFVGRPVRARLIRPLENGQRELTGILLRAEEDGQLELQLDEETSVTLEKKECSSVHSVEEDFDEEEE